MLLCALLTATGGVFHMTTPAPTPPDAVVVTDRRAEQWLGIPGIERSPRGTLWVSAFTGGQKEPGVDNRVITMTSTDDGRTWSDWTVQADPPGGTRAFDPTLWLDPRGRLWLIYNVGNATESTHEVWARVNSDPDSPASPFSEPRRLALDVPYAFRMNKPIVTSWGEWVLPVTWARRRVTEWFAGEDQLQGVAISSDEGETWTMCGAVAAPPWALENMIVERRDGTLWMLIRGARRVRGSRWTDLRGPRPPPRRPRRGDPHGVPRGGCARGSGRLRLAAQRRSGTSDE
jgi:hypothetical protein